MVIFSDLSEVLCHGVYGMEDIITRRYGEDISNIFLRRHDELNDEILHLFRGEFCEDCYWMDLLSTDELPMSLNEVKQILTDNISRDIPGTLDVYKSIKAHPRRLGSGDMIDGRPDIYITSDHIAERVRQLGALHPNIFSIVEKSFWSCDLKHIKQDPEFFQKVLSITGLKADKVVFIDDIKSNIKSAERHGIYSILFQDAEQLKSELIDIGFQFI